MLTISRFKQQTSINILNWFWNVKPHKTNNNSINISVSESIRMRVATTHKTVI